MPNRLQNLSPGTCILSANLWRKGRETLKKTAELASDNLKLEVIYGDTDSIMINSGFDDLQQALEVGNRVQREVNKSSQHLEIAIDGIFKPMLLNTKKKYAAISLTVRNSVSSLIQ